MNAQRPKGLLDDVLRDLMAHVHDEMTRRLKGQGFVGARLVATRIAGVISPATHGVQTTIPDAHHDEDHAIDGATHTASGLTTGHVLTATSAAAFAFQANAGGGARWEILTDGDGNLLYADGDLIYVEAA